jgi:hypothetical protein
MYAHANLKRKNIEGSTIESTSANQNPQFNQQINLQNNYSSEVRFQVSLAPASFFTYLNWLNFIGF